MRDKRVLVVDDNETNCRILKNLLERGNMLPTTFTFTSASTAAERLRSPPVFDLILLDMMMPEMSGMELAERIRAIPLYSRTPILLQ
ncbi:MAG: response regulator [Candidatus Synoicihabitans palmerolidicus]|nr:response regulator [Candidatus Synoicihabitans palmerolidicus]